MVFPVLFPRRFQTLEHHASRHGIAARDVRVVETFDVVRQSGKPQFLLQFLHQTRLFLLGIQFFRLFQAVEFILFSVHDREVEQCLFVTPLGDGHHDSLQWNIDAEGQDNLLRIALESLPHLHDS